MIRNALKVFANQYLLTPFNDVCNATGRAEKSRRKRAATGCPRRTETPAEYQRGRHRT